MPSPVRASTSIRRLSQTARQLSNSLHTMASAQDYKTRAVGSPNTLDYRVFLENTKTGLPASPFHDVPLFADESKTVLNMIVEIPRWTNAKVEISKEENFNAFKQRIDWLIQYANVYKTLIVVPDFIWYAGPTSRTRAQLQRLARETNGIYLPFADWFFSDGTVPTISPLQLNSPLGLWADTSHPGPLGNELIFATIATAMGLPVTSKKQALRHYDWAYPLKITHTDFTNDTPTLINSISTIRQNGSSYHIKMNVKHTSDPIPTGTLYDIVSAAPAKFRNVASLALMDEYHECGINSATGAVNGLMYTSGNGIVRGKSFDAFISKFRTTLVVEPNA